MNQSRFFRSGRQVGLPDGPCGEGEFDSRHQPRIGARIEAGMECLPHSDFQRYHGHIA